MTQLCNVYSSSRKRSVVHNGLLKASEGKGKDCNPRHLSGLQESEQISGSTKEVDKFGGLERRSCQEHCPRGGGAGPRVRVPSTEIT